MIGRLLHPIAVTVVVTHLTLLALAWWALQHVIPDTLVLHVFGRDHLVSEVHRRVIDRLVDAGVLVPAVFLLEYLWMGWSQSSVRQLLIVRTASVRSDIACYLFTLAPAYGLISAVMSFGVVYFSGEWMKRLLAHATGIDLSIAGAPLALQTALLFILYSLLDYWNHRLDHSRVFWPLHRFHHSAESFSVLTAARLHPAMFTSVVTSVATAILPGVLLGSDRAALVDVAIVIGIHRLVLHSRIESDFGWVGRWMVQSPLHHRMHHSLNRMPVNLGLLPIWDRLFGTWREAPREPMRIGTVETYRHGVWVWPDMWRDYCEFWTGLRKLVLAPLTGWASSRKTTGAAIGGGSVVEIRSAGRVSAAPSTDADLYQPLDAARNTAS